MGQFNRHNGNLITGGFLTRFAQINRHVGIQWTGKPLSVIFQKTVNRNIKYAQQYFVSRCPRASCQRFNLCKIDVCCSYRPARSHLSGKGRLRTAEGQRHVMGVNTHQLHQQPQHNDEKLPAGFQSLPDSEQPVTPAHKVLSFVAQPFQRPDRSKPLLCRSGGISGLKPANQRCAVAVEVMYPCINHKLTAGIVMQKNELPEWLFRVEPRSMQCFSEFIELSAILNVFSYMKLHVIIHIHVLKRLQTQGVTQQRFNLAIKWRGNFCVRFYFFVKRPDVL